MVKNPLNLIWRIKENEKIIAKGDFLKWEGKRENKFKERTVYILEEEDVILSEPNPCNYFSMPVCGCPEKSIEMEVCYLFEWLCICDPPLLCHRSCSYVCYY